MKLAEFVNCQVRSLKPYLEFRWSETHRVMDWWSSPFYGKIMENRPCLDHIVSITLLLGGDLIPLKPLGWSSCAKLLGCLESSGCGCENHRHWGWTQILTSGSTHLAVFFVMTVPPGEVIDQKYPRGYCVLSPHVHGLHSMFRVPFPSIDPQPSQSSLLRSAALRPTGRRFQCHVLRSRSRSSLPLGVLEGSPGKLLMVKHHSSSHP